MKLCIDCKYCVWADNPQITGSLFMDNMCNHEICISRVNGKPVKSCESMREGCSARGCCGYEATYFEPKEKS